MSIKILVCDDQAAARAVVLDILKSFPELEVVGQADGGNRAVVLSDLLRPEVVLMDILMPDLNGIEATRQIVATTGGVKVVALSMHSDSRYVRAVLRAGASGYVLKSCAYEELVGAIRTVVAGETYLSPGLELAAPARPLPAVLTP